MAKETCAVILAAGNGSRLNCKEIPKAMVEVGGKPVIGHPLNALYNSQFTEESISVVVGRKKKIVSDYCFKSARICEQPIQDGNLSAIESALVGLPQRFTDILVIHADDGLNLSPYAISSLLDIHEKRGFSITLLLSHNYRSSAHRKHYLLNESFVSSIQPISQTDGRVNVFTGVYCFDRKYFEDKAKLVEALEGKERQITPIINMAFDQKSLGAMVWENTWLGINTPIELAIARELAGAGLA
jgi:bifunctional N-acetylglucosamine-1-phosphate-uridyltransferase/glucosamine-1-phosphate-acetyltransferase GlmU-like protein